MKASTTRLSMEYLRDLGYTVEVVERWTPSGYGGGQIKRDLFGILDLVAVRPGETLGVQTTSRENTAARATKIVESEHIGVLWAAGWRIVVHGWWLYEPPPGGGYGRKHYEVDEFDVAPRPTPMRLDADARPIVDVTRSL
jgi:hypothetical protein